MLCGILADIVTGRCAVFSSIFPQTIDWDVQTGWEKPRIVPYGPLQMVRVCSVRARLRVLLIRFPSRYFHGLS